MKKLFLIAIASATLMIQSCSENYGNAFNGKNQNTPQVTGKIIDTIYVVIDRSK
jgi:hypothetical protein